MHLQTLSLNSLVLKHVNDYAIEGIKKAALVTYKVLASDSNCKD